MDNNLFRIKANQRLIIIVVVVGVLLLVPLVAMQFTNEVNWDIFDFVAAGLLLLATGLLCEFVLRTVRSVKGRVILCGILLLVLFFVWAELAVGVFGSRFSGS